MVPGDNRYREPHDRSRVLPEVQGERASSAGEAGPPGFPTLNDLKAVNRAVHDDAGQPERYALDQPSPLQSALDRARREFEPSPEALIRVAALLAHGIAQAQGFRDDNRRTAYLATKPTFDVSRVVTGGRAPSRASIRRAQMADASFGAQSGKSMVASGTLTTPCKAAKKTTKK